jgi:DNA-binding NtrC family response regulator
MITILFIMGLAWCAVAAVFLLAICKISGKALPVRQLQSETILAIDDDTAILEIEKAALEEEGYTVHTVANPQEALQYYSEHWRNIKLVLLDFLMPEMTGDRVFECMRTIDPQVPVLLVTGHYNRIQSLPFNDGTVGCLSKPFALHDLIRKVRDTTTLP